MRITKSQLRRTVRRVIKESMKDLYGDVQNEILALAQDQGGEVTVQDVVDYLSEFANDPLGDHRANHVGAMEYEEVLQIMADMVEAGLLIDGYEDFFSVHPDYMG